MARGGRRQGVQGRDYSNRTDLTLNAKPLPVQTATGQGYGVAGQQAAAQKAIPLASGPSTGAPALAASGGAPAPNPVQPGSMGGFHRPTERPGEPVTAGAALGPGPGPEALGGSSTPVGNPMAAMLAAAAATSGSRAMMLLAQRAQGQVR